MMKSSYSYMIVLMAIWVSHALIVRQPAYAQASEAAIDQLDVRQAIELAHQLNPDLNTIREEINWKAGQKRTSYGIHAPVVSYAREGIDQGAFNEQRFVISQSIDFPLTSYYRVSKINKEQRALEYQLELQERRTTAEVKSAYTELLFAQELVHLRTLELNLGNELVDAARIRTEAGESAELELMKAELQRAEALSRREEAGRLFDQSRYALFNVIGLDPEEQLYTIAFPDTLVYVDVDITQEEVLMQLSGTPEIQGKNLLVDAARLGVKRTQSSLLPALQFDYFPQDFGSGYENYGFQVGLSVPLLSFSRYRGQVQMAKADVQVKEWSRQAAYLDLKTEVEQAWHSYETSKKSIDRYTQSVRARSNELLEKTREGYLLGEIELLSFLDTQRLYLQSELRYYEALRQYYIQLVQLEQFIGEEIVWVE